MITNGEFTGRHQDAMPFHSTFACSPASISSSAKVLAGQGRVSLALGAAAALVAFSVSAPAFSADVHATASATIVAPMAIASATNLSFGNFDASRAGTVTVDTAGNRTASGVTLSGGTPAAATFSISGQSGLSYNIAYSGTSASLSNGADTMGLTIVSDVGGAPSSAGAPVSSGTLSAAPTTLRVGGTLTVNAGTPAGIYNGTISVTVQYQ